MNAYENYLVGNDYLQKSEYRSAIDYFIESNKQESHYKTYEKLFLCYYSLNLMEEAFECIRCSYELNSKNDKTALQYAKFLIEYKHDHILAKAILSDILRRNPSFKPAEKLFGELCLQ